MTYLHPLYYKSYGFRTPNENDRVTFEKFGQSHYRSREVGEAIRSLDMAKNTSIYRMVYKGKRTIVINH